MSFDLQHIRHLTALHGPVARVVIAEVAGSAPREVGAAMVVWPDGQDGTIGGGALEYEAAARARAMLAEGAEARLDRMPLGPALAQCCGGAVTLLSEIWDEVRLQDLGAPLVARALPGKSSDMPLAVSRALSNARGQGILPATRIVQGWFLEPLAKPTRDIWIWGAGHVGRALVSVLVPHPDFKLTWIDVSEDRFPDVSQEVVALISTDMAATMAAAPPAAEHMVMTFSHALDLEICHQALLHGAQTIGLIGSATKWARFRSRLAALGHSADAISRITCPIGNPELGKHPQAIAIGVAGELMQRRARTSTAQTSPDSDGMGSEKARRGTK